MDFKDKEYLNLIVDYAIEIDEIKEYCTKILNELENKERN